jgi:hypothetical protein
LENSELSSSKLPPARFLLPPYALLVATLYLWAYWRSFSVDVFEHISLTEVVKIAAYPILSAFFFSAIGVLISEVISIDKKQPSKKNQETAFSKFMNRWVAVIMAVILLIFFISIFFVSFEYQWIFSAFLIGAFIAIIVMPTNFLESEINSASLRLAVVFIISVLVPFSYAQGSINAHRILKGKDFLYQAVDIFGSHDDRNLAPKMRLRYLGKLNDRFIFFDPVKETTVLLASSDVKSLELKRFREPTSSDILPRNERADARAVAPRSQEPNGQTGSRSESPQ